MRLARILELTAALWLAEMPRPEQALELEKIPRPAKNQ